MLDVIVETDLVGVDEPLPRVLSFDLTEALLLLIYAIEALFVRVGDL